MPKTCNHTAKAEYILTKGLDVVWSKGYNGASVNDIVKVADIPKGSFYFYFKSKEDFVIKALERYFDQTMAACLPHLEDTSISAKQRIINFCDSKIELLRMDIDNCVKGCLACNLSGEMAEQNENIRSFIVEKEEIIYRLLIKAAYEAQEDGDIAASMNIPDVIAFIEDAFKGSMVSMKSKRSIDPVLNVLNMTKHVLFG